MSNKVKENTIKNNTIFTIDLLKGSGIPQKSGPVGLTIAVITAFVPLVIAISFYGLYLHNKVTTRLKKQDVLKIEAKTVELSDAVKMQKSLEKEKVLYNTYLSEVGASIGKFTQWSPVLTKLVEEMPETVVLTNITVEQDSIEKEVPKKDDPEKKIKINIPVTQLVLELSDLGQGNCDEDVKVFRDRLYSASVFGSKLDDITPSRRVEKVDGKDMVTYQIKCMFKPEL